MKTANNLRHFTLLLAFFLSIGASYAQDYIHTHNGAVIEAKIVRIGISDVTYFELPDTTLQLEMKLSDIAEISLENGKRYTYDKPDDYLDLEIDTRHFDNAVAIGFFTPLYGDFRVEYDRLIKPGQIAYSGLTIIGLGLDYDDAPKRTGVALNLGYKFLSTPEYSTQGMRRTSAFRGGYIMPQLTFSTMSEEAEDYSYDPNTGASHTQMNETNAYGMAILLNLGKQWVYGGRFFMDFSFGLGYSFTSVSHKYAGPNNGVSTTTDFFGNMGGYHTAGNFAFTSRFSIGYLF